MPESMLSKTTAGPRGGSGSEQAVQTSTATPLKAALGHRRLIPGSKTRRNLGSSVLDSEFTEPEASFMKLTVNGDPFASEGPLTVRALIERLGLDEGPVAVECNREIVPRAQHTEHALRDGDVVEIVHFVGGG
jgi:sulfur carrier protein